MSAATCSVLPRSPAAPVASRAPGGNHRAAAGTSRVSTSGNAPRPSRPLRTPAAASLPELPDLDDLDLEMPELLSELEEAQQAAGAVFNDAGLVAHFTNDSRALYALEHSAVVVDRSHWGRLRLSGEDRLAFLHGQTTNDVQALAPGTGCDTVFVTAQARCIDLATVYAQPGGALVTVSPGLTARLLDRLQKHIFPADKVQVADISGKTCMFSLLGPQADEIMQRLQAGAIVGAPAGTHTLLSFGGKPVIAAAGGGLPGPGYTFICDESVAAALWKALAALEGVEPLGCDAFEVARVLAGRPAPGSELTEDFNPLEAGLYGAISLQKGCYIGQETLAKVHNLNAVKQQLWALDMEAPCVVGDEVLAAGDGRRLGKVTSYADTPSGQHRALAYLKCRFDGQQVDLEGAAITAGGSKGRVIAPPFLSRAFAADAAPAGAGQADEGDAAAAAAAAAEEEAREAARRAEKLRQMQERLAAFQAAQQQQQQQ